MDFSKLPTDNFYIFICFAGLGIVVFFVSFFTKKYTFLFGEITKIHKEIIPLSRDVDYLKKYTEVTSKEIKLRVALFKETFGIEYKIAKDEIENLKIPEHISKKNKSDDYITQLLNIEKLFLTMDESLRDVDKVTETLTFETENSKRSIRQLRIIMALTILMVGFGCFMMTVGLYNWYDKYQFYQDQMTRINYEKEMKKSK